MPEGPDLINDLLSALSGMEGAPPLPSNEIAQIPTVRITQEQIGRYFIVIFLLIKADM